MLTTFRYIIKIATVVVMLHFWVGSIAQIEPAKIFSDNMVLQRDIKIPIWGDSAPCKRINIQFKKNSVSVMSDSEGTWKAFLPECKAGGPYFLQICDDSDTIIFRNILVGDVWFASGQSNMAHPVQGWEWIPHSAVDDYEKELKDTDYSEIRLFNVPKFPSPLKLDDLIGGEWQFASPASVAGFSSISWFFAKKMNENLKIPIGIIHASWGGTAIQTWLDRESLELFSDSLNLPTLPQNFNPKEWEKISLSSIEKQRIRRDQISYPREGLAEKITREDYNDSDWNSVDLPFEKNNTGNIAWFRKKIDISSKYSNQSLTLSLGFLNRQSNVFFNDTELGYFQYPKPVKTEISPEIIKPGENILTIRLAQPFGNVQIIGEKDQFFIADASGFLLDIAKNWKMNSGLELINKAGESYQSNPAFLFNGMVAPVIPYGIKGFIWYQGESNTGRPFLYKKMFKQLITSWRQHWQLDKLPFLFIQLSNIELNHHFETNNDSWCLLREAQREALELQNTGMVASLDIGNPYDVHPKNKKEFAERLALQAEEKVYGEKVVSDGPMAESFRILNNEIIVTFKSEGKLLINSDEDSNGFEIAGSTNRYFPAEIKLQENQIMISSPQVEKPVAARYAWRNNPKCTLYNSAGLPATPFNTKFLKKE